MDINSDDDEVPAPGSDAVLLVPLAAFARDIIRMADEGTLSQRNLRLVALHYDLLVDEGEDGLVHSGWFGSMSDSLDEIDAANAAEAERREAADAEVDAEAHA